MAFSKSKGAIAMFIRKKNIYHIIVTIICIFVIFIPSQINAIYDDSQENLIVYFFSSTCSSCVKVSKYLDSLNETFPNLKINRINVADPSGKALLSTYNHYFNVDRDDEDITPVIFVNNVYATGEEKIQKALDEALSANASIFTPDLSVKNDFIERDKFNALEILSVFAVGLVNGLNPCGLSMLLLFITVLIEGNKKFINAGLIYCLAKFITYFLLGTVLYSILTKINFAVIGKIGVVVVIAIMFVFACVNIWDLISIKREKYAKIKLQLPKKIKNFNHKIIGKFASGSSAKIYGISFGLGAIISFGEFLCTGQIYLGTIITVLNTQNDMFISALFMFLLYNMAMIVIPLLVLIIIRKTYDLINVADYLQTKLPWIKIINAIVYIAFGIIIFKYNF